MNSKCDECGHDWHGSATCRHEMEVELRGTYVQYFTAKGEGPLRAFDVLTSTPETKRICKGECACKG